jgi:hypothetical protein
MRRFSSPVSQAVAIMDFTTPAMAVRIAPPAPPPGRVGGSQVGHWLCDRNNSGAARF